MVTDVVIIPSCLSHSYISFTNISHSNSYSGLHTITTDSVLSITLHLFDHYENPLNISYVQLNVVMRNHYTNFTTSSSINVNDVHAVQPIGYDYELMIPMLRTGLFDISVLIDYYTVRWIEIWVHFFYSILIFSLSYLHLLKSFTAILIFNTACIREVCWDPTFLLTPSMYLQQ